jgi:hypothetical protein
VGGNIAGGVERLTPPATHLRSVDGTLHVVPNGAIRIASNIAGNGSRDGRPGCGIRGGSGPCPCCAWAESESLCPGTGNRRSADRGPDHDRVVGSRRLGGHRARDDQDVAGGMRGVRCGDACPQRAGASRSHSLIHARRRWCATQRPRERSSLAPLAPGDQCISATHVPIPSR